MNEPFSRITVFMFCLWILFIGDISVCAADSSVRTDFWPRLIRLTMRPKYRQIEAKNLLMPFGLTEPKVPLMDELASGKGHLELKLVDEGDPTAAVRVVDVLVPAGQETRWIALLQRLPEVEVAARVPYDRRGASDGSIVQAARAPQISSDSVAVHLDNFSGASQLNAIDQYLRQTRFKGLDVLRDPLTPAADHRLILTVFNARNQVLEKYWQFLTIDITLLAGDPPFNVVVDGRYASGAPGGDTPSLHEYHNPLYPEYAREVDLYRQLIGQDIRRALQSASRSP